MYILQFKLYHNNTAILVSLAIVGSVIDVVFYCR